MADANWKKIKEYLSLLALNLSVKAHSLIEYIKVIYRYYRKPSFAKVDASLELMYLFDNPFSISRRYFMHQRKSEEYTYGETPITTFHQIVNQAKISSKDNFYELGCGRGRLCFWLSQFIGCKVVGVDIVADFILRANRIKNKLAISKIEFKNENFLTTDLKDATVIYLYGTCLEDETIKKLIERFKTLPLGTKIITVSYPLADYTHEPLFEIMKRFPAKFSWGKGDVYIQIRK